MNLITPAHRYVSEYTKDISFGFTSSEKKCCRTCANCSILYIEKPRKYTCNTFLKIAKNKTLISDDTLVQVKPCQVCSKWRKKSK